MTDFEWFEFNCDRSTFSVTVSQPTADNILAVLQAAKRWYECGHEEHEDELGAAIAALCAPSAEAPKPDAESGGG